MSDGGSGGFDHGSQGFGLMHAFIRLCEQPDR